MSRIGSPGNSWDNRLSSEFPICMAYSHTAIQESAAGAAQMQPVASGNLIATVAAKQEERNFGTADRIFVADGHRLIGTTGNERAPLAIRSR